VGEESCPPLLQLRKRFEIRNRRLHGLFCFHPDLRRSELGVERKSRPSFARKPAEGMYECIPYAIEDALHTRGVRIRKRQPVRSRCGMIRRREITVDLLLGESRLSERRRRSLSVRPDLQRFAGRIVQVSGELSFPVSHTAVISFELS